MAQEACFTMPVGLDELRLLLEKEWPARRAALRLSGVPVCEDDPDPDPAADPTDDDPEDQKTFDAAYVKKLRAEAAKHRKEAAEAKARAKEFEDADKSEAQKLEERATGAETRAVGAEREALRLRVALKKGLSETQAKRLIGDTEADLEADADDLLASFKNEDNDDGQGSRRTPRERLRPGAVPSADPNARPQDDMNTRIRAAAGR